MLIDLAEFKPNQGATRLRDPYWYFTDTTYGCLKFDVRATYPHAMYVHWDVLDGPRAYNAEDQAKAARKRVYLRGWIDRCIESDVMFEKIAMGYTRVYNMDKPPANRISSDISHGYYAFYFMQEHEAFAFRCSFDEARPTASDNHPDYPPYAGAQDFKNHWDARTALMGF